MSQQMPSAFAARLDASYFDGDELISVALVQTGATAEGDIHRLWLAERLFARLQNIARAYELHWLPIIELDSGTRLNEVQCQGMLDELTFISTVISDPVTDNAVEQICGVLNKCIRGRGSAEFVIEGP